jgi:hypothetical protein
VLDLDGQVLSHTNYALSKGAVLAIHNAFDCEILCLAWPYEPVAGQAVLWLLSHEARLVMVGDVTHCGGSFPLAVIRCPFDHRWCSHHHESLLHHHYSRKRSEGQSAFWRIAHRVGYYCIDREFGSSFVYVLWTSPCVCTVCLSVVCQTSGSG